MNVTASCVGLQLAEHLSNRIPHPSAFGWSDRFADACWYLKAGDRKIIQDNLSLVLDSQVPENAPMIREVFRNFGRYLVEFFSIHRIAAPQLSVEGYDHLASVRAQSKGAVLLTAHLGNWEVGAVLVRRMGFPMTSLVLAHRDAATNRLFDRQRLRCGVRSISLDPGATLSAVRALREGQLVGVVGDWLFGSGGIELKFCRRTVVLPRGPAILSIRANVPIIPTFLIREGIWRFKLYFGKPMWPRAAQLCEAAVSKLSQDCACVVESYIKRFPDQWLLFHRLSRTAS